MLNIKEIALLGVIFSSAFVLSACNKTTASSSTTSQSSGTSQEVSGSPAASTGNEVVITFGDSGFSPVTANAKVGDMIIFTNNGAKTIQVNSDPHPVHTSFKELNIGAIAPGESKSTTLTKVGTYTYHDHLNPAVKGSVVVE